MTDDNARINAAIRAASGRRAPDPEEPSRQAAPPPTDVNAALRVAAGRAPAPRPDDDRPAGK